MPKRKRVVLSLKDKINIINSLKKGESGCKLAAKYGVGTSTISDIKKNTDSILKYTCKLKSGDGSKRKVMKKPKNELLEEALYCWFLKKRSTGQSVSGSMLCEKALQLNKKIDGDESFLASNGWLYRFKCRHGIRKLEIQDENMSTDTENSFKDSEVQELLVVEDSEQSESDHGVGPHFTKFRESTEEQPPESPHSRESNTERSVSRESTSRKRKESNEDPLSDSFQTLKRQRRVQHSSIAMKQNQDDFSYNKVTSNCIQNEEAVIECDLYGQLLAQKLKPLDVDDRLVLMNEIDNLVFKYMINIRKRNKSRITRLTSTNQTNSDNRQHIDLPGPSSRSDQRQDCSQKKQNSRSNSIYEEPFRIVKAETEA